MRPRHRLEATLRTESRAYGYTLSVWGTGSLLIGDIGLPTTVEVFAVAAAVTVAYNLLLLVEQEAAERAAERRV